MKFLLCLKPILFVSAVILPVAFFTKHERVVEQNVILKSSLVGIGGKVVIEMIEKGNYEQAYELLLSKHGLMNYHWRFPELGYPVPDPKTTYVYSDKGWRVRLGRREFHFGNDLVPLKYSEVIAMEDSKVYYGSSDIYGKYLLGVGVSGKYRIRYSHLSARVAIDGGFVQKGQLIGIIGDTGNAQGVHLDIEVYKDGRNVNIFTSTTYKHRIEL